MFSSCLTFITIKYYKKSNIISSINLLKSTTSIPSNFSLNPVQDVVVLAELNSIYFDFERFEIRQDAANELDKIVSMMTNEYPNMVIRIESHTDSRGTTEFNDWLSNSRAKLYIPRSSNGLK